jgi:Vitelline membrane outer layer protein I (VOMI)
VTPNLDSVNDKTAVNNIEFTCTNGEVLLGDGINRGDWGEYSDTCSKGICGLQTLVQADSGTFVDDTSLNDVKFLCC